MLNVPDYQCFNFHKKINFLFNFDVIFSHFMSHLNLSQTKHRHKVKKKILFVIFSLCTISTQRASSTYIKLNNNATLYIFHHPSNDINPVCIALERDEVLSLCM